MSSRSRSETNVISALINTHDINQAVAFGVTPDMFVQRQAEYRWADSYQKTYGKAPSPEALLQKFPGFPYLEDRTDVPFYVEELIHGYNQRELTRTIKDAATQVAEGDMDEAIMTIGAFRAQTMPKPLENALHKDAFLDRYHEREDMLTWPWQTMTEVTSGMRKGELYYLAARLGQGKSWSLTSLVCNALMQGRDVMFYSLEMSEEQVLTRIHVLLGKLLGFDVDHIAMRNKIYDVLHYRKIMRAIKDEVPGQLFVHDTSKGVISPATLLGGQNKEMDLIVVDHAGLLHTPSGSRAVEDWRAAAQISNQLKEVALGQNVRVLSAAQINREGDVKDKWPPKVKHLAQSDALGQDADTVITHKRWGRSTMCYSIEKTRDGYSEVPFFTKFEPNHGLFTEISRDEAEDRWEEEKAEE